MTGDDFEGDCPLLGNEANIDAEEDFKPDIKPVCGSHALRSRRSLQMRRLGKLEVMLRKRGKRERLLERQPVGN